MDVDAAGLGRLEDWAGQDQPISRHHREIGVEPAEPRLFVDIAQRARRPHWNSQLLCALMHRGPACRLAAARRARRLAISRDRKSTRLNSSHVSISYAVFCLKKKKKIK